MDGLDGTMPKACAFSKRGCHGKITGGHDRRVFRPGAAWLPCPVAVPGTSDWVTRIRPALRDFSAPDSQTANPIPVCSPQIVNAARELWTSGALPVDGLAVPLRGFRKSHHLTLAGRRQPILDFIASDASCQRVISQRRA